MKRADKIKDIQVSSRMLTNTSMIFKMITYHYYDNLENLARAGSSPCFFLYTLWEGRLPQAQQPKYCGVADHVWLQPGMINISEPHIIRNVSTCNVHSKKLTKCSSTDFFPSGYIILAVRICLRDCSIKAHKNHRPSIKCTAYRWVTLFGLQRKRRKQYAYNRRRGERNPESCI